MSLVRQVKTPVAGESRQFELNGRLLDVIDDSDLTDFVYHHV